MNQYEILNNLFFRYPELQSVKTQIIRSYELLCDSYEAGGRIFVCGNGGSAADSEHFVGELIKGFKNKRRLSKHDLDMLNITNDDKGLVELLQKAIPAFSLSSQIGTITAISNDISYDMIYAQQLYGYSNHRNDILVGFSTSGKSATVVNAVKMANILNINSICITGKNNSFLSERATCCIQIPYIQTDFVQECTQPIYHTLALMMEQRYFAE